MRPPPLALVVLVGGALLAHGAHSNQPWVAVDGSGRLIYRTLPHGDHIADFSYAGYGGGGVPLPHVAPVVTVTPSGGDDTAAIQRALDQVSGRPLHDGFRGAVVLASGTFSCSGTLHIAASGVVLRGSGTGPAGTTLRLTGDPHVAIEVSGDEKIEPTGPVAHIVERYVPSGSQSITVDDASAFAPSDVIRIARVVTPQWLHLMGMDHLSRNGKPETWVHGPIRVLRTVTARDGNVLHLDVPLTDSYDRKYLPPEGAEVTKVAISGRIEHVGIESLHLLAPARSIALTNVVSDSLFRAMNFDGLRDGWVRDVLIDDTTEGIDLGENVARMTVENVLIRHLVTVTSAAKPADFAVRGTQILLLRCGSMGDDLFFVITGSRNQGPNVVLDCKFLGDGHVQPHQRWATGLLVDNTQVPQGGIDLKNRGEQGSGHGWTMGWGVIWNSFAATLVIQNPPGAANWSIGTSGQELTAPMPVFGLSSGPDLPQGIIESPDHRVAPDSLYRAQLAQRLGPAALKALER